MGGVGHHIGLAIVLSMAAQAVALARFTRPGLGVGQHHGLLLAACLLGQALAFFRWEGLVGCPLLLALFGAELARVLETQPGFTALLRRQLGPLRHARTHALL